MHGRGPFRTLLDPATARLVSGVGFDTENASGGKGLAGTTLSFVQPPMQSTTATPSPRPVATTPTAVEPVDQGFPADTPVTDMTDAEQAAYWRAHAQRHEKLWRSTEDAGLAKRLEAVEKERDDLKAKHQTETEKAIDAARQEGRNEARAQAAEQIVAASFAAALAGRLTPDQVETYVDGLNHLKFLDAKGKVDTAKIREHVETFAPAGSGSSNGRPPVDLGQGRRTDAKPSGKEIGLAEAHKRFGAPAGRQN